ncbi:MAG TPA: glutamate-cysteine ligase family protein [Gemmatimonadaceae bacterium]|nr:glutamate-cysteine ligase family protein [Gemmatimonadaceae bacterium]
MSLTEAELLDDVRQRLFAPIASARPRTIGLELELIPIYKSTRARALATAGKGASTSEVLSQLGRREKWREESIGGDPPSWNTQDGARISFEPGGQIEISTAPQPTASGVIDSTQGLVTTIKAAMSGAGIELLARGVDPYNDLDAVPLQLHRDRYTGMTRYFDSIGPSGVRMMRQTAALQVNLERGEDPRSRWRLLNSLAPIVVALFANSRQYAGKRTDWASYRAQLWRTLDPSRTGLVYDEPEQVERYLRFALDAVAMRSGENGVGYRKFREWMTEPAVTRDDWQFHLSTLFPEVRPKEFFELRSPDSIEPDSLAAPVVFVTGLVYDEESAQRAMELIGVPSEKLLERAGRLGLADPEIRRIASRLVVIALEGGRRLSGDYLRRAHLEAAYKYFAGALAANDI